MTAPARRLPPPALILGLLYLFHLSQTLWVLMLDQSQPYLAIFDHYFRSVEMHHIIGPHLLGAVLHHGGQISGPILDASGYRPPLTFLMAQPLYSWFGVSHHVAAGVNLPWIGVLLWATYRLGLRLAGRGAGVTSALAVGAFPIVLGHRSLFLPFLPVGAAVAAAAAAALAYHQDRRRRHLVWLGVWTGLGLLMRWDFGGYLIGIVLWLIWSEPSAGARLRMVWRLCLAAAVTLLVAGWWYGASFNRTMDIYGTEGILSTSHSHEGNVELLSVQNLTYYPRRLATFQIGWPLLLIALVGAALMRWRRHPGLALVGCWLLAPWVLYLLIPMKSARYTIAMMPAFALLIGVGVAQLRRGRRTVAVAVCALALLQQVALCHLPGMERLWPGLQRQPPDYGYDVRNWEDALDYGQLRPWTSEAWIRPLTLVRGEVQGYLQTLPPEARGDVRMILVERPQHGYAAALELIAGVEVELFINLVPQPEPQVRRVIAHARWILIAGPGQPDMPEWAVVEKAVAAELALRRLVIGSRLPDGNRLLLYGPRR